MDSWDKEVLSSDDYSGNMKARVAIFNMNGRASIWWEHFKQVKRISERRLKWKQFKKYFKQKYLSDRYYDDKIKEFHELRLGQYTMDEYENKFLELLRYVRHIRDEKVKIQWFLIGFPQAYKDRIEFYEPRTLEEAIRKAKYCYEQSKGKPDYHKAWKDKKNESLTKERKVSNLLDLGISKSIHPKLQVIQLE